MRWRGLVAYFLLAVVAGSIVLTPLVLMSINNTLKNKQVMLIEISEEDQTKDFKNE